MSLLKRPHSTNTDKSSQVKKHKHSQTHHHSLKPTNTQNKPSNKIKTKTKTKDKSKSKAFIPVPGQSTDDEQSEEEAEGEDEDMVDQDLQLGQDAAAFLNGLDKKGITRSRQDQILENRKARPKISAPSQAYRSLPKLNASVPTVNEDQDEDEEKLDELDEDDFALLGSDDDDDDLDLMSDMSDSSKGGSHALSELSNTDTDFDSQDDFSTEGDTDECLTDDSALEKAYYASKRSKPSASDEEADGPSESKLPVKLADGTIQRFPHLTQPTSRALKSSALNPSSNPPNTAQPIKGLQTPHVTGDSSYGSRFGRISLPSLLTKPQGKKAAARAEIADLAREAIADPEMSLSLIKRLIALCLPSMKAETSVGGIIKIDPAIRFMAILSLLSVFLDIIPGYRIRTLGEAEKQAAVSQMVARQREWEDGLVSSYKRFLEICEKEVVTGGVLAAVGLKCLCRLLTEKTHFNFAHNIMDVVVRKLGRKEWDPQSQECVDCITAVFKKDTAGNDSLQLVKLIGRIIKSRDYSVHPEVLATLLSLRLKEEISCGIRASTDKVYGHKPDEPTRAGGKLPWKDRVKHKKGKTKPVIMSKKAKKAMKDRIGIEKEIQEAEETVKTEEKQRSQTETLKLVFALYFRILKLPHRSVLLPAALEGLAKFSHLVNIDFFRDLMSVLRQHIEGTIYSITQDDDDEPQTRHRPREELTDKLICILTAFELLSGQGEALNVDLTEFINDLYAILIPLGTQLSVEDKPQRHGAEEGRKGRTNLTMSNIDLLFKTLHLAFLLPRSTIPPLRALAFTKRLMTISLSLAASAVVRVLEFLVKLVHRQPAVKALLLPSSEEDRLAGALYRPELDDVGLSNAQGAVGWEVYLLEQHWDGRVKDAIEHLLRSAKEISG